jgi:hypothetical protein
MGVGIVPLQSVKEEVEKGKLIRWWIEGAQINWELGIAQLSNGYDSPIMQKFVSLAHKNFEDGASVSNVKKTKSRKK